mmetsp:Transcript_9466/g.14196  ORF Transcript_9466/g.14196 Transcript_9466/m.14196 type:complete len:84 (+) Transcript_9466:366-617(+)
MSTLKVTTVMMKLLRLSLSSTQSSRYLILLLWPYGDMEQGRRSSLLIRRMLWSVLAKVKLEHQLVVSKYYFNVKSASLLENSL